MFLESLDNRERKRNLVITGLSEESDVTRCNDVEKVCTVISSTGYQLNCDPASLEIKRLGKEDHRKKRPLLVVEDGNQRNEILRMAKNLKSIKGPLSSVYVKKDVHPAVRKEMARLRQREREEKEKPENVGASIVYDWKKRVLLRDGNIINKFSPYFFLNEKKTTSVLKLCSWNICGVKEKLNDSEILKFLMQYDLVWLLEVKSVYQKSVPGFYMYNNMSRRGSHRGGVTLLIKCALMQFVTKVDMDADNMIWVELSVCEGVKFGGVYIPPEDSLYCEASPFQTLSERCSISRDEIVLGDFNARVGSPVMSCGDASVYKYDGVKDPVVNSHGRMLLNMCRNNNMVVMNHLNRDGYTLGDLSFRRGSIWISEIDLRIGKFDCIRFVSSLEINQTIKGSDHAPLCVDLVNHGMTQGSPTMLLERAKCLSELYQKTCANELMWRSPRYDTVNLHEFKTELESLNPPDADFVNFESVSNTFRASSEIIHGAARRHRKRRD